MGNQRLQLVREMAASHIMVEINLTSNDVILNVKGANHPFPVFRANHLPIALSTDDEGVSRIDLTHEYVRAVEEYDLSYADLKQIARTSLEHSFLPGPSLWAQPDAFTRPVSACSPTCPPTCPPPALPPPGSPPPNAPAFSPPAPTPNNSGNSNPASAPLNPLLAKTILILGRRRL